MQDMHNITKQICFLCERLAAATNRSVSTISRLSTGSGATYNRLMTGRGITVHRAHNTFIWFARHWPKGLPWPSGIKRPKQAAKSKAAISQPSAD